MKRMFLVFTIVLVITSCYQHEIRLNSDKKSGTMTINYELDDDSFQIISLAMSQTDGQFDPMILIDEDYFKIKAAELFEGAEDLLTLKSVKINQDNKTGKYQGKIVLDFTDFEEAISSLPEDVLGLKINRDNYNNLTVSQEVNLMELDPDYILKDFVESEKDDNPDLYDKITKYAIFDFTILTATPIKKATGVKLSNNKKKAEYSFSLGKILEDYEKSWFFSLSL